MVSGGDRDRKVDDQGQGDKQVCIRLSDVSDHPSAERMLASHSWKVVHVDMTSSGLYIRRVCERCGMNNTSLMTERGLAKT